MRLKRTTVFLPIGMLFISSGFLPLYAEQPRGATTFSFVDSGQRLGTANTRAIAVADLDGDGDWDIAAANVGSDQIWLNHGQGRFTAADQELADGFGNDIALVDVDNDSDPDAITANTDYNRIWLNDGTAHFVKSSQVIDMGDGYTDAIGTGDLDGDGDMDAFFGNRAFSNYPDQIWFNNGTGVFTDTGQRIGFETSNKVAVDDVDQDKDYDVIVATCGQGTEPNKIWLNNGTGHLTDSGQILDQKCSAALAVADVDNDADVDIVIGNAGSDRGSFTIWLNNGTGTFSKASTLIDTKNHLDVDVGDIDGDGDPDLLFDTGAIWLNDGTGQFTQSDQTLSAANAIVLKDLDGDRDLDAILAMENGNQVWFNQNPRIYHSFVPFITRGS